MINLRVHKNKKFLKVFSNVCFAWKTVLKYSSVWALISIAVVLLSAIGVLMQVKTLERLINIVKEQRQFNQQVSISLILCIGSMILMNLFSILNGYLNIQIQKELDKNFIPIVLRKYDCIEYAQFELSDTQDIFQRVSSNPQSNIKELFNASLTCVSSLLTLVELLFVFLKTSIVVGISAVILVIPMLVLNIRAAHWEMRQRWNMTKDIRKRYYLQSLFVDKHALQEIKVFDSKDFLIGKSEEFTEKINKDLKKNIGRVLHLNIISAFFLLSFIGIYIFVLSILLLKGMLSLGIYVTLIYSIGTYYAAEQAFVSNSSEVTRLSDSIEYLEKFFELPEICANSNNRLIQSVPEIEFSHVTFKYPNSNKIILDDISFVVKKGESISFVGENGAGKSTIVKLICGLYKPTKGTVKIGGIPTENLSFEDLKKIVSVVFQDGLRYELTLRENIAFGNINMINEDSLLVKSLKQIGGEDLLKLPEGIDQPLGRIEKNAVDLSGGQWQRVTIARALLSKAVFLILDEPTASLDPLAENYLYTLFHSIIRKTNRGAIMISHRLASGKMSDRIIVLRNAIIEEQGTHDELMKADGYYADMYRRQSSWYVDEKEVAITK